MPEHRADFIFTFYVLITLFLLLFWRWWELVELNWMLQGQGLTQSHEGSSTGTETNPWNSEVWILAVPRPGRAALPSSFLLSCWKHLSSVLRNHPGLVKPQGFFATWDSWKYNRTRQLNQAAFGGRLERKGFELKKLKQLNQAEAGEINPNLVALI